jgi:hypothetical protein
MVWDGPARNRRARGPILPGLLLILLVITAIVVFFVLQK